MRTNDQAKRTVLYGDSLVYGKQSGVNAQLPVRVRFSGVLQELLGDDYDVIEEGLRARNLCGENPFFAERNGLEQFGPIVGSHLPASAVVIALGTNDCNNNPDFDATKRAESLRDYVQKLEGWATFLQIPLPRVLVMLPPDINQDHYDEAMTKIFGAGANERVGQLRQALAATASELDLACFDASKHCQPAAGDGIHLDEANNRSLAEGLKAALLAE